MKAGTSRFTIMIMALLFTFILAVPVFAVPDDSIDSQHITEADGTSGQDTNSGSGIKTGHIQDGAVTDSKISGIISASKLEKYANVVVVAKSGGDFTDPVTAINSITSASAANPFLLKIMPGVYTLTSPLRMKEFVAIEGAGEGVTILQTNNNWYNVYGSDNAEIRNLTVLNMKIGAMQNIGIYSVGTSPSIKDVSVFVSGANNNVAIFNYQGSNSVMRNVTAVAEGGSSTTAITSTTDCNTTLTDSIVEARNGTGSTTAINMSGSVSTMSQVYAKAEAPSGVTFALAVSVGYSDSTAVLKDVEFESTDRGVWNQRANIIIYDSIIQGDTYGLYTDQGGNYKIALTQIKGPITTTPATFSCFQVYDANYTPAVCP